MHNKDNCYEWLAFCKKFLINSWKFVLKKYSLNSHLIIYSQFAEYDVFVMKHLNLPFMGLNQKKVS